MAERKDVISLRNRQRVIRGREIDAALELLRDAGVLRTVEETFSIDRLTLELTKGGAAEIFDRSITAGIREFGQFLYGQGCVSVRPSGSDRERLHWSVSLEVVSP